MYLKQSDYKFGAENNHETFSQEIDCRNSELWYNSIKDGMDSMASNEVCDLMSFLMGQRPLDAKGS